MTFFLSLDDDRDRIIAGEFGCTSVPVIRASSSASLNHRSQAASSLPSKNTCAKALTKACVLGWYAVRSRLMVMNLL